MSTTKKTTTEEAKVYVKPCNIATPGVQIRIKAEKLNDDAASAGIIKPELEYAFVDDFKSPSAISMQESYVLSCHWGNYVGERRDYYYCDGNYKAPELDESKVIKRFIFKDFSIGFAVEENNIGKWTDASGTVHNEGSIYYLTVKTIDAECSVAG